jgi:haloalkane dehalogenase
MLKTCKQLKNWLTKMEILKTPTACFNDLPGYSFQAHYCDVGSHHELLMHYVDYGPKNGPVILMLHGEPSWSYLYRNMINEAASAGFRIIAPDLIGFGKSDKYASQAAYTYANHLTWLAKLLKQLSLNNIHLICQDWGGLLGLRLVASQPDLYAGVVAANTMLPVGGHDMPEAFLNWQAYSQSSPHFDIGSIIQGATHNDIIEEVLAAYNAPFPDETYKAGARKFPMLVPIDENDPEAINNKEAWKILATFNKPFLTAFSDNDPITKGGEKIFQKLVPGCKGQAHSIMKNSGHFLQEDCSYELITLAVNFFKECKHG